MSMGAGEIYPFSFRVVKHDIHKARFFHKHAHLTSKIVIQIKEALLFKSSFQYKNPNAHSGILRKTLYGLTRNFKRNLPYNTQVKVLYFTL